MKKEFLIDRQGKQMVLFAGLVDLAHEQGLVSIVTEAVSVTANLALFKATATFKDGRVFTEHGDATPENVGRNIVPHFIRMAETRAKARALRDALNIGAVSLEELGDDDHEPARPQQRPAPAPRPNVPPTPAPRPPEVIREREKMAAARAGIDPDLDANGQPLRAGGPTPAASHPAAKLGRNPELLDVWDRIDAADSALAGFGVTATPPPADADEATLNAYLADARTAYADARKAKRAVPA